MGEYNPGDSDEDANFLPEALYQTGDTNERTMWKLRHSDDFCLINFPGIGSKVQLESFCARMGGSIPRLDDEGDRERFRQAGHGKHFIQTDIYMLEPLDCVTEPLILTHDYLCTAVRITQDKPEILPTVSGSTRDIIPYT